MAAWASVYTVHMCVLVFVHWLPGPSPSPTKLTVTYLPGAFTVVGYWPQVHFYFAHPCQCPQLPAKFQG